MSWLRPWDEPTTVMHLRHQWPRPDGPRLVAIADVRGPSCALCYLVTTKLLRYGRKYRTPIA